MPDRSERMWQKAYEMARSGRYSGVDEVAKALCSPAILMPRRCSTTSVSERS